MDLIQKYLRCSHIINHMTIFSLKAYAAFVDLSLVTQSFVYSSVQWTESHALH